MRGIAGIIGGAGSISGRDLKDGLKIIGPEDILKPAWKPADSSSKDTLKSAGNACKKSLKGTG